MKKLALYRNPSYELEQVLEYDDMWEKPNPHYIRISEIEEVKFFPRKTDEVVCQEIATLNAKEATLRRDLDRELTKINTRRSELMQLTYIPPNESKAPKAAAGFDDDILF